MISTRTTAKIHTASVSAPPTAAPPETVTGPNSGLFARGPQPGARVPDLDRLLDRRRRAGPGGSGVQVGPRHRHFHVVRGRADRGEDRHPVVGHGQEPVPDRGPDLPAGLVVAARLRLDPDQA